MYPEGPYEMHDALFGAVLAWRDELAPGAAVNVVLEKNDNPAEPNLTGTRIVASVCRLDAEGYCELIAMTVVLDSNLAAALVRLTEDKAKRLAEKNARLAAEEGAGSDE